MKLLKIYAQSISVSTQWIQVQTFPRYDVFKHWMQKLSMAAARRENQSYEYTFCELFLMEMEVCF